MTAGSFVLLLLLGAAVGTFGTLVGAGGGFILAPVLLLLYPSSSPATITSISLAAVFANAASGSIAYAAQRRIDFRVGGTLALAAIPGAVAGSLLVGLAPRRWFDLFMGAILAGLAIWLLAGRSPRGQGRSRPGTRRVLKDGMGIRHEYAVPIRLGVVTSAGVGFLSSFLGIGGGVLHVPLLMRMLGFPTHIATATSHFVLANLSLVGTVTHISIGDFAGGVGVRRAIALSVGMIAGAQLGARLSPHMSSALIQRLLALALVVLALRLLLAGL